MNNWKELKANEEWLCWLKAAACKTANSTEVWERREAETKPGDIDCGGKTAVFWYFLTFFSVYVFLLELIGNSYVLLPCPNDMCYYMKSS